jgi:lipopolysaccharide transport system ATP-binding protein
MDPKNSLEIKNLSKIYKTNTKTFFSNKIKNEKELYALNNINLEIKTSDRVGIIGLNGSGKSTLLKIISRVTCPTTGSVLIRGKVSSILEAGTGFNFDLPGLDNIFISGAILGMNRNRIQKKLENIIEFSELGEFIKLPVKKYSSGMKMKLALAICVYLDGDIFILDEVMVFSDEKFRKKCISQIKQTSISNGKTVLFVSHDFNNIKEFCNKIAFLENGELKKFGPTDEIIKSYQNSYSI